MATEAKEPWVSGFSKDAFATLMSENGFTVQRDISMKEIMAGEGEGGGYTGECQSNMGTR